VGSSGFDAVLPGANSVVVAALSALPVLQPRLREKYKFSKPFKLMLPDQSFAQK
jgi:hypothetical protein